MPNELERIAKLVRYWILKSTTEAGSGHPTTALSATDLTVALMFGGCFKFDTDNPKNPNNDRLIFSKGHASPLFYALWAAADAIPADELMTLRKFGSRLEGHPTMEFPFTEAPTGSLGQGLSIGVGIALNAKYIDKLPYRTYVLLGDSEMAEGSVWEAIQSAVHYKLDNLVGIIDVNRLGQRGETMYGHSAKAYEKRVAAFGWHTIVIDGHSITQASEAFNMATKIRNKPVMIIAKTIKGKGVSLVENKDNWHGKALKPEELEDALEELGTVDTDIRGTMVLPENVESEQVPIESRPDLLFEKPISTRRAYGNAIVRIFPKFSNIVVLDAETSNSTYAEFFKKEYPDRFFEMYIAEQNMVGAGIGFATRGKIPFVSTFAAFFSRAFDQIRMSQYSDVNIKYVGSHAGVSIGEDGSSQMALADLAFFRSMLGSVVLYPSDGVSTDKLVEVAAAHEGIVYIRTTRGDTPILYTDKDTFSIGGSKVVKSSKNDTVTVVGAGITLHEALKAYEELQKEKKSIRVIDLYSIKPIDTETLERASKETKAIITVEDHSVEGGLGAAVRGAFEKCDVPIISLAVTKPPKSGTPAELLEYEGISAQAIVKTVKSVSK